MQSARATNNTAQILILEAHVAKEKVVLQARVFEAWVWELRTAGRGDEAVQVDKGVILKDMSSQIFNPRALDVSA